MHQKSLAIDAKWEAVVGIYFRLLTLFSHFDRNIFSIIQVVKGGQNFLQSSLKGINPPKAELIGDGVRQYIAATKAGDQTLPEFLTVALAELCKEKPAGLDAVKWLGQWMIDNNPNQPQIEEPED